MTRKKESIEFRASTKTPKTSITVKGVKTKTTIELVNFQELDEGVDEIKITIKGSEEGVDTQLQKFGLTDLLHDTLTASFSPKTHQMSIAESLAKAKAEAKQKEDPQADTFDEEELIEPAEDEGEEDYYEDSDVPLESTRNATPI